MQILRQNQIADRAPRSETTEIENHERALPLEEADLRARKETADYGTMGELQMDNLIPRDLRNRSIT
jgi:hypothetical protein